MVAGHSGAPFTHFIYLFHMAVFFIASGFFFKDSTSDNWESVCSCIKRKIKGLWFPFVAWNTIFVLLHNFFIKINIYTNNPQVLNYVPDYPGEIISVYSGKEIITNIIKGFFMRSREQMFGACWFIEVLFLISVLYLLNDYLAKKFFKNTKYAQLFLSCILLVIGYLCSFTNYSFYGLDVVFSCYSLYYLGVLFRKFAYRKVTNHLVCLISIVVFLPLLLCLSAVGSVSLGANVYVNPLYMVVVSISGWLLLYSLSCFLSKARIRNLLICVGRNSFAIVVLHFLSMKTVELIIVLFNNLPLFCLSIFPNLFGKNHFLWAAYTFAGVFVPIVMKKAYCAVRMRTFQK